MAKPRKKRDGTWSLVVQYAGNRRNLTLGRLAKSQIDDFAHNIEELIAHAKYRGKAFPQRLQVWVTGLSKRHKIQLSQLHLFAYETAPMTVGELMDRYEADYRNRSDVTASSKTKVSSTIRNRLGKFRHIPLSEIEPVRHSIRQNADPVWTDSAKSQLTDFNSWQRNHFAAATWTRDNKLFSSVGIWAVKHGICDHNPFSPLPSASMVNDERNEYLTTEMVQDAMDSCLSADIRLTLAMGRFAGMRTCSEVRTMKWSHVDADAGTLTVIDAKKKTPRVMPLFVNVAAELDRQRKITGKTRFVASEEMRASSSSTNFQRIRDAIIRSGQTPWPRVRQNLRTSCENDMLELFDERLVTKWLGHTVSVSRNHYQKLRPSDYRAAIARAAGDESSQPDCQ